jgi:hypothetical protein
MMMMMMMMMMMRRERTSAKVKLVGGNQPVSAEATGGSSLRGGSKDQKKHVKGKTSPSLLNPNRSSSVRVGSGD